jgi:hypothetical protein
MPPSARRENGYHYLLMLQHPDPTEGRAHPNAGPDNQEVSQSARDAELLALFRLLVKEPPPDHDFRTCPICKQYGITSI